MTASVATAPTDGGAWRSEVIARVLAEVRAAFGEPLGQPCSPAAIDTAEAVLAELARPPVIPRPRETS
jgi:hypothetical protein